MKTLRMVFGTSDNDKMTISLNYAKEGLTSEEVRTAMQAVIDHSVFVDDINSVAGASMTDRIVTELI